MPVFMAAVVTHYHCKITEGAETQHSDPDPLMSCQNLYRITGSLDCDEAGDVST